MYQPNISRSIASRIVQPAIEAMNDLKRGEVSSRSIRAMGTQAVVASLARNIGMKVPATSEPYTRLCRSLREALESDQVLEVDEEDVHAAERWLLLLREQLARAKKHDLNALISAMLKAAGA